MSPDCPDSRFQLLGPTFLTDTPPADTVLDMPKWMRMAGWVFWQLLWLGSALIVYANLFSEYGAYGGIRVVNFAAAVVLIGFALWIGTWLPVRTGVFRR